MPNTIMHNPDIDVNDIRAIARRLALIPCFNGGSKLIVSIAQFLVWAYYEIQNNESIENKINAYKFVFCMAVAHADIVRFAVIQPKILPDLTYEYLGEYTDLVNLAYKMLVTKEIKNTFVEYTSYQIPFTQFLRIWAEISKK